MNWKDDFAEGFKCGERNETSLGMVLLFVVVLCAILAALIIAVADPAGALAALGF